MKLNDVLESKFLKQEDIDGDTLVTVESVKKQNVAKQDEDPEYKLTAKFVEYPKPLVVNATNAKRMFKALGDDTDEWIGKQIVLYVDPDIEYGGKIVGGLRVRSTKRSGTAATPKRSIADANAELGQLDDDIPF